MPITLSFSKKEEKTGKLHLDHETWIRANIPQNSLKPIFDDKIKNKTISYDALRVFYSSSRVGQTSITQENNSGIPCDKIIYSVIQERKTRFKNDKEALNEIYQFEKRYKEYFSTFIEKSLVQAVHNSIKEITSDKLKTDKNFIKLVN